MAQNENLSRTDLLTKLKTIFGLYQNTQEIQKEMDNFAPVDNYLREVVVPEFPGEFNSEKERVLWRDQLDHSHEDAVEIASQAHRKLYAPEEPKKPKFSEFKKPAETVSDLKQKIGCFPIGAGFVAIVALGGMTGGDELGTKVCWVLLAICAAMFVFTIIKVVNAKKKDRKAYQQALAEHERSKQETIEKYNVDLAGFEKAQTVYEQILKEFLKEYSSWRQVYIASLREEAYIEEKLEADRVAEVNKIYAERYVLAENKLKACNDLVSEEYLPVLGLLIDLIESGRADDLKEAINLYEDIVYRERQLKLQREIEEQRQHEEELRRQDEERRYQEEKRFREGQERQRQREEERRRQDVERHHREEMDQRDRQERDRQYEERRRAEEDRRRADRAELDRKQREDRDTRDQCNRCAQASHCSMAFRRPNCASFRPK